MTDANLERILRDHSPLARRLAASHEANVETARDLAQEILVAVWRAWPAFRHQCSERTYVARIAHNRIVSLMPEGFTPGEVAETLGLTTNAVAIRATRALMEMETP